MYRGRRGWSDLNDVVQPIPRPQRAAQAPAPNPPSTADWSRMRKAQPADHLLPQSDRWFDALPPEVAPCALATQFPRIVNLIVAHWYDPRSAPNVFEELLVDRRGGRAGFPPAVRRDLLRLREFWYSGGLKQR